jgi:hypothetical protein
MDPHIRQHEAGREIVHHRRPTEATRREAVRRRWRNRWSRARVIGRGYLTLSRGFAVATGYRAGLAAVGHLELSEDVRHVDARRLFGDEQAPGDPPVGEALGQEFEYLAFARGEAGRCPGRGWPARARGSSLGTGSRSTRARAPSSRSCCVRDFARARRPQPVPTLALGWLRRTIRAGSAVRGTGAIGRVPPGRGSTVRPSGRRRRATRRPHRNRRAAARPSPLRRWQSRRS